MARKPGPVDLFGEPVRTLRSRSQSEIERYDERSRADRVARLNYVKRVHPRGGFGMPIETMMLFTEAKMAFIDGLFVSVLLLCNASIEHTLGSMLEARGFREEAARGLAAQVKCARKAKLLDEYLLRKADQLRAIRNPFVHLKPFGHEHGIGARMLQANRHPHDILEADARAALSIMYAFVTHSRLVLRPG